MAHPRLNALKRELYYDHWKHIYNWIGVDKEVLAKLHSCSVSDVEEIMREIETKHPKPNKTKDEKLADMNPNGGHCRSCGAPIVWIDKHPCNPAIQKFVQADGSVATGRISHFSTCPDADKWRKR